MRSGLIGDAVISGQRNASKSCKRRTNIIREKENDCLICEIDLTERWKFELIAGMAAIGIQRARLGTVAWL